MSFFTFVGMFICLGIPAYIFLATIWCWLFGYFTIKSNGTIIYQRKNGRRII